MKRWTALMLLTVLLAAAVPAGARAKARAKGEGDYRLVWSDEFDADGVDAGKWRYDLGNMLLDDAGKPIEGAWGWGNFEKQCYQKKNASVASGVLTITARKEDATDSHGVPCAYTSARLTTQGKFSFTYGRVEFRARCDSGKSLWPAVWMLPEKSAYGWPFDGEIDVMEMRGSRPGEYVAAAHYGQDSAVAARYPSGDMTSWHVYALEWTGERLDWFVDGERAHSLTGWRSGKEDPPAPFDKPFRLIVNLAVGGRFDGAGGDGCQADPSVFAGGAKKLEVDYIRVYQIANPDGPTPTPAPSPTPAPGAITVTSKTGETSLYVKGALKLLAGGVPVKWFSGDARIASVSAKGIVKGKKPGIVRVTAISKVNPSVAGSIQLTVRAAPKKIALSVKKLALRVGGAPVQLSYTVSPAAARGETVAWSSGNGRVALVLDGLVTPVGAGKTKITARTGNGRKAVCTVTVAAAEH